MGVRLMRLGLVDFSNVFISLSLLGVMLEDEIEVIVSTRRGNFCPDLECDGDMLRRISGECPACPYAYLEKEAKVSDVSDYRAAA